VGQDQGGRRGDDADCRHEIIHILVPALEALAQSLGREGARMAIIRAAEAAARHRRPASLRVPRPPANWSGFTMALACSWKGFPGTTPTVGAP
jgi:hypothetical protein